MTEEKISIPLLVVDDDPVSRALLEKFLIRAGYNVTTAKNGHDALRTLKENFFSIVISDWMMPEMDGIELCKVIRNTDFPGYIFFILITSRDAKDDLILGLEAGADDYLTKPFGVGELLARLRAALRRITQTNEEPIFTSGKLKVDLAQRIVTLSDNEIQLTPNEYELLRVLVSNVGRVLTHRSLLRTVWGLEYGDEIHMLHVNISNLRRKIETDPARPQFIITEPGVGYRFRLKDNN